MGGNCTVIILFCKFSFAYFKGKLELDLGKCISESDVFPHS